MFSGKINSIYCIPTNSIDFILFSTNTSVTIIHTLMYSLTIIHYIHIPLKTNKAQLSLFFFSILIGTFEGI